MLRKTEVKTLLTQIPIIQQSTYFLQQAGVNGGIKLTEKGALGRSFVQEFWDLFIGDLELQIFRPMREFECPEVTRIHFLLSESKYVRKFKGKICLTEKGRTALQNSHYDNLFCDLFTAGIYEWNWAYEDRFPDYEFIQQSAEELVYELQITASADVTPAEIFEKVFGDLNQKISTNELEEILHCLTVRFFYRFCIPFGILKNIRGSFMMDKKPNDKFEKSEFFMNDFSNLIKSISTRDEVAEMDFTPAAQEFWNSIAPQMRVRIMNNVFCSNCRGETGIGDVKASVEQHQLILKGVCTKCGGPVTRLVEGQ